VLSSENDEVRLAFLETALGQEWWRYPNKTRDIRALLDGNLGKSAPDHIVGWCAKAEGALKIYSILTKGGYLHLSEEDCDLLEKYEADPAGRRPRDTVPIELRATGTFRRRNGASEDRHMSIRYARWGYRLHFGYPSE
jgi:hypothetical protein